VTLAAQAGVAPVLVAVFGFTFLGEQLSVPNWLGILLIAGGAYLVAYR